MGQVFIYHIKEDAEMAATISKGLEATGYSTWYYERDNHINSSNPCQSCSAIDGSDAAILLISEAALESGQVAKELDHARDRNKPLILLLIGVSHLHIQNWQPKWREVIGTMPSFQIDRNNTSSALPHLFEGLKSLNILPRGHEQPLMLAIMEAALDYTLYTVSLLSLAIAMKKQSGLDEGEALVRNRVVNLNYALAKCYVETSIPDKFQSSGDIQSFLTRSPLVGAIAIALRQKHSEQEGLFFMFCVLIGGIISARESGVDSGSAAAAEARKLGKYLHFPEDVLKSCIEDPGFNVLREYLKTKP
jgi:hypothetical protein